MFFQLGMMEAAFKAATGMHYRLRGDLFLINSLSDNLQTIRPFLRSQLFQARSIKGVADVSSLYTGIAEWRNPENQTTWRVQVYGFNPDKPAMELPEVAPQLNKLKSLNSVLYDRAARPDLGNVAGQLQGSPSFSAQINDLRTRVVGMFTMGASFSANGNLIVSDSTFLRLFPQRQPSQIDIGVITLKPDASLEQVQASLKTKLPDDVLVLTKEEFIQRERNYWSQVSPIGVIFGFGTIVGFLVGTVIVYQILYSDVSDHLPEYATLKAMGYSDRYLINVLLQEALILAILGFLPGFIISLSLYSLIARATFLPVLMTISRAVLVLSLTLIMCISSGAIAMRKLQSADPADIF
jgi:putative ABC transport system permease protein